MPWRVTRKKYLHEGMSDYVSKPINPAELMGKVALAISGDGSAFPLPPELLDDPATPDMLLPKDGDDDAPDRAHPRHRKRGGKIVLPNGQMRHQWQAVLLNGCRPRL